MYIADVWKIRAFHPSIVSSSAKIYIVDIHEVTFIQAAQCTPLLAPYEQERSLYPVNVIGVILAKLLGRSEHTAKKNQAQRRRKLSRTRAGHPFPVQHVDREHAVLRVLVEPLDCRSNRLYQDSVRIQQQNKSPRSPFPRDVVRG